MPGINLKQVAFIHIQIIVLQLVQVNLLHVFAIALDVFEILEKPFESLDNCLSGNIRAPYHFLILLICVVFIDFLNHVRRLTMMIRIDIPPHLALTLVDRQVWTMLTDGCAFGCHL
jgi:hypothetical protein